MSTMETTTELVVARPTPAAPPVVRSPCRQPTSGLDPVVARVIDELISAVRQERGVTSVVVSHHIPSIMATADRVAMIYEGRLQAVGTVEEIRHSRDPVVRQFVEGRADGPIQVVE
jgi:phospholipid/cholesterol/gamma-HCH transport system ATP-binding protein